MIKILQLFRFHYVIFFFILLLFLYLGLIYLVGTLDGHLSWHVLPSVMFGPPHFLVEHGFTPFYTLMKDCGWDGQQYYYAANDIFDTRRTSDFLDGAKAMRYERIGLGLVAFVVSRLLGQSWISPSIYFLTNFGIVFLSLALLLNQWKKFLIPLIPSILIYCSPIVYLTVFNGLLDAAADSLFIIFVIALLRNWRILAILSAFLCPLTREAFFIPFFVFFSISTLIYICHWSYLSRSCSLLSKISLKTEKPNLISIFAPLVGIIGFLAWQIWLRYHFGVWPSQVVGDITDKIPFRALFLNLKHAFIFRFSDYKMKFEFLLLLMFSLLMLLSLFINILAINKFVKNYQFLTNEKRTLISVCFTGILFFILYSFFGNTVMMNYTGYLKPVGILFFSISIALLIGNFSRKFSAIVALILSILVGFSSYYVYSDRIADKFPLHVIENIDQYGITSTKQMVCLLSESVTLKIIGIQDTNRYPALRKILKINAFKLADVSIKNIGKITIQPSSRDLKYPVFVIGEIKDSNNAIVSGWRSVIRKQILPGKSINTKVLFEVPFSLEHYNLKIILIQPGCEKKTIYTSDPFYINEST